MKSINEEGFRFRYVIELENGMLEFLTYKDALKLLRSNSLIENLSTKTQAQIKPLEVLKIRIEELIFSDMMHPVKVTHGILLNMLHPFHLQEYKQVVVM